MTQNADRPRSRPPQSEHECLHAQLSLELQIRQNCQELLNLYKETQDWSAVGQLAQTLVASSQRITTLRELLSKAGEPGVRPSFLVSIRESKSPSPLPEQIAASSCSEEVEEENSQSSVAAQLLSDCTEEVESSDPTLSRDFSDPLGGNCVPSESPECGKLSDCFDDHTKSSPKSSQVSIDNDLFTSESVVPIDSDFHQASGLHEQSFIKDREFHSNSPDPLSLTKEPLFSYPDSSSSTTGTRNSSCSPVKSSSHPFSTFSSRGDTSESNSDLFFSPPESLSLENSESLNEPALPLPPLPLSDSVESDPSSGSQQVEDFVATCELVRELASEEEEESPADQCSEENLTEALEIDTVVSQLNSALEEIDSTLVGLEETYVDIMSEASSVEMNHQPPELGDVQLPKKAKLPSEDPSIDENKSNSPQPEDVSSIKSSSQPTDDTFPTESSPQEASSIQLETVSLPEHNTQPESTSQPESSPQPESTSQPESSPQPGSTSQPESCPQPESTSQPESSPQPESTSQSESSPQPESTSQSESSPQPESTSQPESSPQLESTSLPESSPQPESTSQPESSPQPESTSQPESSPQLESTSLPESSPQPESTSQPESSPQPKSTSQPESSPQPESTSQPESSPQPESTSQPESSPQAESTSQPESSPQPESTSQPESSPQAESTSQPESSPQPESTSQPESSPQPESTHQPESSPQPESSEELQNTAQLESEAHLSVEASEVHTNSNEQELEHSLNAAENGDQPVSTETNHSETDSKPAVNGGTLDPCPLSNHEEMPIPALEDAGADVLTPHEKQNGVIDSDKMSDKEATRTTQELSGEEDVVSTNPETSTSDCSQSVDSSNSPIKQDIPVTELNSASEVPAANTHGAENSTALIPSQNTCSNQGLTQEAVEVGVASGLNDAGETLEARESSDHSSPEHKSSDGETSATPDHPVEDRKPTKSVKRGKSITNMLRKKGKKVKRSFSQNLSGRKVGIENEDLSAAVRPLSPITGVKWDPTCLLEELYSDYRQGALTAGKTGESARHFGYLNKLPMNKTKPALGKGYKRRYFRAMEGKLFYYEDRSVDKALGFVRLEGSRVVPVPEKMQIQIVQKDGKSLMLKASDVEDFNTWHKHLLLEAAHPTQPLSGSPLPPHNPGIVIIDIGACSVRAGFASENAYPELFFPAVASIDVTSQEEMGCGIVAMQPESRYGALQIYPRKFSRRMDQRDANTQLRALDSIIGYVVESLDVDPQTTQLVLTLPSTVPESDRNDLMELLFERYGFAGVCAQEQAILALYSYNTTSGIVVDIGDHVDIVPIIDGYIIEAGVSRLPFGGNAITESLSKLITARGIRYFSETELYIIRLIKERLCFVSEDFPEDARECDSNPVPYTNAVDLDRFQLPDHRKVVTLDNARFKATEGLFTPGLWGKDVMGLHDHIWKAIQACPIDQRKQLSKNIYLSGGCTLLPGLQERLQKELSVLAGSGLPVTVHAGPSRQHAAYIGASVLASLGSFSRVNVISLEEWSKSGVNSLEKWKGT